MNLEITKEQRGEITVLKVAGRVDAANCQLFQDETMKTIDGGTRRLVMELSRLDYVSSAGLRVFLVAAKKLKTINGRLVLATLQPQIREILDIAGFTPICPQAATLEEAVKSLGG